MCQNFSESFGVYYFIVMFSGKSFWKILVSLYRKDYQGLDFVEIDLGFLF